jgi:TATA-box binding protein (TBP) (component of TFIID and TFIIIB)
VCHFQLVLLASDGSLRRISLNLELIQKRFRERSALRYNPQRFGSANFRSECRSLGLKNVSALVFSTGQVVCPGPSSVESSLLHAHLIALQLSRVLGAPLRVRDFKITNIVAKITLAPIDLAALSRMLGHGKTNSKRRGPTTFPACFVYPHKYGPEHDCVVYLCFATGMVVITGCSTVEQVRANQAEARAICEQFPLSREPRASEEPDESLLFSEEAALAHRISGGARAPAAPPSLEEAAPLNARKRPRLGGR